MKNKKAFVLVKEEPEYINFKIVGVFSEEGMQRKLQEFAEQEREVLINFAGMTEKYKQKRTEITQSDTKLLENAGQHLTTAEIHMHEKNMREIEELTRQIAVLNTYKEKNVEYADEELARDCMSRLHLVFQEFVVE